jgi:predicted acylesterase/phospholipase RssA
VPAQVIQSPSGAITLRLPAIPSASVGTAAAHREGLNELQIQRVAYVLSGGGAKGSFEMGAIQRLYEQNMAPSIVAGTSVGAINAIKLAEGGTDACTALYSIWRSLRAPSDMWVNTPLMNEIESTIYDFSALTASTDNVPTPFMPLVEMQRLLDWMGLSGNAKRLKTLETAQSLFSLQPIRQTLEANIDLGRISRSGVSLRLATVELASGNLCYATEASELCCDGECQPVNLIDATMASASIPVFFEPVRIGGKYYVDGGVREVVPLLETMQAFEPETTFVILASPLPMPVHLGNSGGGGATTILDIGKRTLDILTYDVFFNDLLSVTGVANWEQNVGAFFESDLHFIAPMFEVHDTMDIDPYLIRYNMEYGWMVAADVLDAREARGASEAAWTKVLSERGPESVTADDTLTWQGSLDTRLSAAIAAGETGQYLSHGMSPFQRHRRLAELSADITWLRREDLRITRMLFDSPEALIYQYSKTGPSQSLLTGAGIGTLRQIKRGIRAAVLERIELGGDMPEWFETWHVEAAMDCMNCKEQLSARTLSQRGWIWEAFPRANLLAESPPD